MSRLSLSTADQWLKWMSTAPCLMWRPLSATWVTCCAQVGVGTVPLPPNIAWPGESWVNSCLCSPPATYTAYIHLAMLHDSETQGPNASYPDLQWLHRNDCLIICWICGTKYWDETTLASLLQKLGTEDIAAVLRSWHFRWSGHVQHAIVLYQIHHRLHNSPKGGWVSEWLSLMAFLGQLTMRSM